MFINLLICVIIQIYKNQKIYCNIFVCIMESNAKNNADAIIFHTAICFGAKANSRYGR